MQKGSNELHQALAQHDYRRLRGLFRSANAADIAEVFGTLEALDIVRLFRLIPKAERALVFSYLAFETQAKVLELLPEPFQINLINEMDPVDRTEFLSELSPEIASRIIQGLSPEERRIAAELLSYPEGSVGRIMSPEFIALDRSLSCTLALDHIRWNASRYPEAMLNHIFTTDAKGLYTGSVSLVALVSADPISQPLDDIMDHSKLALSVKDDESEAADFFRRYDLPYIPVLDEEGHLVGIIEPDAAFDVAEEEATEEITQFGGSSTLEDPYFATPFWVLLRKRAGWLIVLFTGSMFTANVLEYFDQSLKSMSFLILFLPLVISSGGNSGSQSASLIIRGLAVRELKLGDWLRVLKRELNLSLWLGLVLGTLGFLRAYGGGQGPVTGLIVALSLIFVVVFGATLGSMLPFILKVLKLDPAVSSSPVIASVSDLTGIFFFFHTALYILKYFNSGI